MNNVIEDIDYIDLSLLFISVGNKLSSFDAVTIARPRIANEIH